MLHSAFNNPLKFNLKSLTSRNFKSPARIYVQTNKEIIANNIENAEKRAKNFIFDAQLC